MVKGETRTGFKFAIDPELMEDVEFLELIVEAQTGNAENPFAWIEAFLGKEAKKALYDHIRTKTGHVRIKDLTPELEDIIKTLGEHAETKNS